MRINELIAGIEGVAAGALATIRLPVNRRFHWLKLFPTATSDAPGTTAITDVASIIDSIEVQVSGKMQRNVTAAFLKKWAAFNGITVPAGCLPIYFSEPNRASVMDEQASAWDLSGESSFTLRVRFKSGIYNVALTGLMCWDAGHAYDQKGNIVKTILRQLPYNQNASSGTFDVVNLPVDRPINRLYLDGPTISKVEVIADSLKVHDATTEQNTALQADYGLASAQFAYPVAFEVNQQLFDNLTVSRDLIVRINSNGGALNIVAETMANGFI